MPVELILRAENKADTIKTEQQYIELQVRLNVSKKVVVQRNNFFNFVASTAHCWCYLSSDR